MSAQDKLVQSIVVGMQEKKAEDILIIDLREIPNSVADYFVVCTGNSDPMVDAIAESIDKEVHEATQENPAHVEGKANREWVLIDYIDVVAHVFKKDSREFYDLEGLWGDAKLIRIED